MNKRCIYIYICIGILYSAFCCAQNNSDKEFASRVIASKNLKAANDILFAKLDSIEKTGDYNKRLSLINELIEQSQTKKCDSLLPYLYNALGNFYNSVGNYKEAISSFKDGEDISLQLENNPGLVNIYTNTGNTFFYMENVEKALEYYNKGVELANTLPNKNNYLGNLYNNIGSIYGMKMQYDKSRFYFNKGYAISRAAKDSLSIAYSLNNFATIFLEMNQYDSALFYFEKAKDLKEKFGAPGDKADAYNQLATIMLKGNNLEMAREYALKALSIDSSQYNKTLKSTYDVLVSLYKKLGDVSNEYKYYKLSALVKDSIMGNEKVQSALIQDFKYEQELLDIKKEAEITEVKTRNIILYIGLAIGFLFTLIIVNRLLHSRKQNKIIETKNREVNEQKEIIEEKQREIIDSINYAKRLQEAILPALNEVSLHLNDSFIYYQPKDIVAGDFYWFEYIERDEEEIILLAAADSTGHGVPGAMVSVVCSNALHRAVNEFKLTDPDKILNKTRDFVIDTFNNTNQEVKDGMDISLLQIKRNRRDKSQLPEVCWAGANNPLWLIRNGEIIEYKADKQPVGMHSQLTPFTKREIQVEKGDSVYLFTDGYSDQFGGASGKKLKAKPMKEILKKAAMLNVNEQKDFISKKFNEWKNAYEQVDDVCIIGIRL